MRKLGIYYAYWTHEWDVDFIPFVSKVKKLGFDQLEVNGGTIVKMDEKARKELSDKANAEGIKLSYGIGLTKENDVSSLDESVRKNGVEFMKNMIKGVASMGGKSIGGTVHSSWPATLAKGVEKKDIWKQSIKSMKEMIKTAEDNDVTLCVEVINRFEQFLLNTCEEALEYVNEIGSAHCKILLDTFHMNIEEPSIGDAICMAGKHLYQLHIGETNRVPPGTGRAPWAEIKKALDDINFDGSLVIESFVMPGGQVGRDIGVWREIIKNPDLDKLISDSVKFTRANLI